MLKLLSESEQQTREIAERLGQLLSAGDILCLRGNLGAGKTVFASGISKGLGISERINSPTYTILNQYTGRIPLYHFDVYRIDSQEFFDIGGDEYLGSDGVALVEWPENIYSILPETRLEIFINYEYGLTENINRREIIFKPFGKKYEVLVQKLMEVYT